MPSPHLTIAYLIDDLGYGGAQKQLSILVRSLPPSIKGVVISMSEKIDPFADVLAASGVEVVALPRRSHRDLRRLRQLHDTLSEIRPDVVHGFLDAANVYAYLSARMRRRPVVLSLRNERLQLSGANARILSWMLRHADRVLVNSRAGRRLLIETIEVPSERILYAQNWVDPAGMSGGNRSTGEPAPPIVGNIGRFTRQKRLDRLIDAFVLVRQEIPGAKLVLMGGGEEAGALADQVRRIGLTEVAEFIEPSLDIAPTLARFSCFVLPSAYEGLPNAAIEALSMGIPLVTNPAGDVADLVVEGKTGILVTDNSTEGMARAIGAALRDTSLHNSARIEGPRLVEQRFSISHALDKLIPMYEQLASVR